jgi:hypothetical protein
LPSNKPDDTKAGCGPYQQHKPARLPVTRRSGDHPAGWSRRQGGGIADCNSILFSEAEGRGPSRPLHRTHCAGGSHDTHSVGCGDGWRVGLFKREYSQGDPQDVNFPSNLAQIVDAGETTCHQSAFCERLHFRLSKKLRRAAPTTIQRTLRRVSGHARPSMLRCLQGASRGRCALVVRSLGPATRH